MPDVDRLTIGDVQTFFYKNMLDARMLQIS